MLEIMNDEASKCIKINFWYRKLKTINKYEQAKIFCNDWRLQNYMYYFMYRDPKIIPEED